MASLYHTIKSGEKGTARDHSDYIARRGKYRHVKDLLDTGHGNLPAWADDDSKTFWKAADRYERDNGVTFREYVFTLPRELSTEQNITLARKLVDLIAGDKPYQYAVHCPDGAFSGIPNPHTHLLVSDRMPDGIERPMERFFARANSADPAQGGRRKDNCGRSALQVRDDVLAQKKLIATVENQALEEAGYTARVDYRPRRERGLGASEERHLGPAPIKKMTPRDKTDFVDARTLHSPA